VTLPLVVLIVVAGLGAATGIRHIYLRIDRPGGLTCSLRVTHGEMTGLGPRFLVGYAGPQMGALHWRRLAWPGPAVLFPMTKIRIDRERPPTPGERWRVPPSFSILPVDLADGVTLELAVPRRKLRRLVDLLGDGPGGTGR
jgi:hypothetical protein